MQGTRYWDEYYGGSGVEGSAPLPSQFGAFVASEFPSERYAIVEFGCGSGRDTLFFARHGFNAVGVDASASAIAKCNSRSNGRSQFVCSGVEDPALRDQLRGLIDSQDVLVYARFFIHAVDEAAEGAFLSLAAELTRQGGAVAVEFRTKRDEALAKLTPAHYRRFVNPMDFLVRAQAHGLQSSYFVEGFGYAKFKEDDAHVARFILTPDVDRVEETVTK